MQSIISDIFDNCLEANESKKEWNTTEVLGFYTKIAGNQLEGYYEQFRHLLHTALRRGLTIMLGESVEYEEVFGLTLQFTFEAMHSIFSGEHNNKTKECLHISSTEDIYRILNDKKALKQLTAYIYVIVQNKFKAHIQKGNQDFEVYIEKGKRVFKPINKVFIDSDYEETPIHELIEDRVPINTSGELTKYILATYIEKLTNKQQQWIEDILEYGFAKDGATYNHQNELLYSPELNESYCKNIKKRLLPWIETDNHIDTSCLNSSERWIFRQ